MSTPTSFGPSGTDLNRCHRHRHEAMGTFFEVLTPFADADYAQQAADAAFAEVDQLEQKLSRYRENSDISRINHLRAGESVRVSPETIACLKHCRELHQRTQGAFDVTVGLLVDYWRNPPTRQPPPPRVGWDALTLDSTSRLVSVSRAPIRLDLGGYGKGYALDQMAERLKDWDLPHFLLHSGQSTYLGVSPDGPQTGWHITAHDPAPPRRQIAEALLKNQSLSASGIEKGRHLIDPRNGSAVTRCSATWCIAPNAATADALSTAFMVMSPEEVVALRRRHPTVKALQLLAETPSRGRDVIQHGWEDLST